MVSLCHVKHRCSIKLWLIVIDKRYWCTFRQLDLIKVSLHVLRCVLNLFLVLAVTESPCLETIVKCRRAKFSTQVHNQISNGTILHLEIIIEFGEFRHRIMANTKCIVNIQQHLGIVLETIIGKNHWLVPQVLVRKK